MCSEDDLHELKQVFKQLSKANRVRVIERAYILLESQNMTALENKKKVI